MAKLLMKKKSIITAAPDPARTVEEKQTKNQTSEHFKFSYYF